MILVTPKNIEPLVFIIWLWYLAIIIIISIIIITNYDIIES